MGEESASLLFSPRVWNFFFFLYESKFLFCVPRYTVEKLDECKELICVVINVFLKSCTILMLKNIYIYEGTVLREVLLYVVFSPVE